MKKKAALSLSVNAIVVLILAIVMLGLGLGFMRGMFGKVTTTMEEQIAAEQEPAKPSGSDTITLSREMVITRAGEQEVIKVSVFNPTNGGFAAVTPTIECTPSPIDGAGSSNAKEIAQGEFETFSLLVDILDAATPDTYLCKITSTNAPTTSPYYIKDITIKVTQ